MSIPPEEEPLQLSRRTISTCFGGLFPSLSFVAGIGQIFQQIERALPDSGLFFSCVKFQNEVLKVCQTNSKICLTKCSETGRMGRW